MGKSFKAEHAKPDPKIEPQIAAKVEQLAVDKKPKISLMFKREYFSIKLYKIRHLYSKIYF